ncbi:MAG: membrane integrity-associated transporter subunit PqiC [Rhodospirillales bacterium]|nr:membrane integrity-associated transporter subunit PqiC [Rhodospirillales bacterium]
MTRRTALLLLLLVGACTSPDPVLYTLRATQGTPKAGASRAVVLRRPSLPRYLDRNAIVTGMPGYKVETSGGERWAEPIGSMFARVLVQDLAQRLPRSTVLNDQTAVTLPNATGIDLDVQEFGPDGTGAVVLRAQAAIEPPRGPAPPVLPVRIVVRPAGATTADLVAAMSEATGQLADALAAALR